VRGWDFSAVRDERDPVPWDYQDVGRRYLRPRCRVLDIGTGGGERFLELVPLIGAGTGIDASPDMVATARAGTPAALAGRVSFAVMDAARLDSSICPGIPHNGLALILGIPGTSPRFGHNMDHRPGPS
jgi:SAM-dependent methyltransferase